MKILQNPIVSSLLLGLILYAVITVSWKAPAHVIEGEPAQEKEILAKAKEATPSWEFQSQEADLLISELGLKAALAKREKDLNDLAERLKTERLEINVVTQAVHQLQAQVEANIVRINAEEAINIKKLSRTSAGGCRRKARRRFLKRWKSRR